jgi:hypothetical protein
MRRLSNKHHKTLQAVFSKPVPKSLEWKAIEALLEAIGCKVINRGGSKILVVYEDAQLFLHRPHPQPEAKPWMITLTRTFLEEIGVKP